MQYRRTYNTNPGQNPFNSLFSLIVLVGILVLLFFLVKGFFTILYWISPVLLVITLILNYRIVADYVIGIFNTFQTDVLMGIVKIVFSILCYPLVIGWLFAKALLYRKVDKLKQEFNNQVKQQQTEEFVDFEELSSDIKDSEPQKPTIFELPKIDEKQKKNPFK